MEKLFVARHGDTPLGGHFLTPVGMAESENMALWVKGVITDGNSRIICSSALHTQMTAQIIAGHLRVRKEIHDALHPGENAKTNILKALELIQETKCDNLIVVTHSEFTGSLINLFAEVQLSEKDWAYPALEKGQCLHLDCKEIVCDLFTNKDGEVQKNVTRFRPCG